LRHLYSISANKHSKQKSERVLQAVKIHYDTIQFRAKNANGIVVTLQSTVEKRCLKFNLKIADSTLLCQSTVSVCSLLSANSLLPVFTRKSS